MSWANGKKEIISWWNSNFKLEFESVQSVFLFLFESINWRFDYLLFKNSKFCWYKIEIDFLMTSSRDKTSLDVIPIWLLSLLTFFFCNEWNNKKFWIRFLKRFLFYKRKEATKLFVLFKLQRDLRPLLIVQCLTRCRWDIFSFWFGPLQDTLLDQQWDSNCAFHQASKSVSVNTYLQITFLQNDK